MNKELIRKALELGRDNTKSVKLYYCPALVDIYQAELETILEALAELEKDNTKQESEVTNGQV